MLKLAIRIAVMFLISMCALSAQQIGILTGKVTDESGAVIPGATIVAKGSRGLTKTVTTNEVGEFSMPGLPPGRYTVKATSAGFASYMNTGLDITQGSNRPLEISLHVSMEKQEVTVEADAVPTVSVEASNNAGALVLRGADLDALPDDPDDLADDLQALAGPSAGPNGGQIFIDGFSNGRLPPKASIREIRINQNPFSAEYDKIGFGRIEIFTKPGSDKFHGQASFNFGDQIFNARNPYVNVRPPFQSRQYAANLGGPLTKKSSFFLDFERRDLDDDAVVNATVLDPNFNIANFNQAVQTPHRRTTFSPRVDYQLSPNHTLVARYTYTDNNQNGMGIDQFNLPTRGYDLLTKNHQATVTETAVIATRIINETRFQYYRTNTAYNGNNSIPTINVASSFVGGGNQVGASNNIDSRYEVQNYTSFNKGPHSLKFGFKLHASSNNDFAPRNYGGTFLFSGGLAPVLDSNYQLVPGPDGQPLTTSILSIQRYQRTLVLLQRGLSLPDIRALGGGPSQFSIAAGNPLARVNQWDIGPFIQDDWRARPNLTLSMGLRYENQGNISDNHDVAPRLGLAWAPGQKTGKPGKTVIRGGFGIFYDRFADTLVENSIRFDGQNQLSYLVSNPNFYINNIPSLATLGNSQPNTIYRIQSNLRAPYMLQTAFGVERQLPKNTTFAVNYTNTRGNHVLRSRNINAPLPGTYDPNNPLSGVRPYGTTDNIYLYESSGMLKQNQVMFSLNNRMSRKISIFGNFTIQKETSNTDGVATFPSNMYNLSSEWGRTAGDQRYRVFIGGSWTAPLNIRFSPFIIIHSGAPFNITTGRDPLGNGVPGFTERPALASALDPNNKNIVATRFGIFNLAPGPNDVIIPRDYGDGPGYANFNVRVSRTWGFGSKGQSGGGPSDQAGGGPPGSGPGGGFGGYRGGGGGRGGPGGGGGRGSGRGGGGMFGDATTEKRFNIVLSAHIRNLFNTTNQGAYNGDLSSPFFGTANSLASSFREAAGAGNRRMDLQLRFMF